MLERWGSFSTSDHLAHNAFVADVMLYDRLVIPVPAEGDAHRWADRDPRRQEKLLSILGDRALKVPWDSKLRHTLRTRLETARLVDTQIGAQAFGITASVLVDRVRHDTSARVTAVAACNSPETLRRELQLSEVRDNRDGHPPTVDRATSGKLATVMGYEFLVPRDPKRTEEDLLRAALELSEDEGFRRKRAAYWRWQDEFLAQMTEWDQPTFNEAINEMEALIRDEKNSVNRRRIKLGVSFAFAVGAAATSVIASPIEPLLVASGFLSIGAWMSDHAFDPAPEPSPAAMCYSAERAFGWKSFRDRRKPS